MHRLVALLLVVCLATQEVKSLKAPTKLQSDPSNEARVGTAEEVIGQGKKQQQHARANLAYNDPGPHQPGVFRDWRGDEPHTAADSMPDTPASQGYAALEAEESRYKRYQDAEQERRHSKQHRLREEQKAADYIPFSVIPDEPAYQNSPQQQQRYQPHKEDQHQDEQAVPPPQVPPPEAREQRQTEYCKKNTHCPTAQLADDVKQAYISHATFTWRTLATERQDKQAAASKVRTASHSVEDEEEDPQIGMARPHRIKETILQQLAKQQNKGGAAPEATAEVLSTDSQQKLRQTEAGPKLGGSHGKAGRHSSTTAAAPAAASTAAASASESTAAASASTASASTATPVSTAAAVSSVDNVKFLLPTSTDETGYGYYGVRAQYLPSDQAIAVGPHPIDPDGVMVIQGAQGSFEINMVMLEDGKPLPSVTGNRVYMEDIMEKAGLDTKNMYGLNPSAWFDPKEKRYVLMWATAIIDDGAPVQYRAGQAPDVAFPLIMVVSANSNPLGDWTVWVLDSVPQIAPGFKFCAGQPRTEYAANSPQGTFSDDAIIVAMGVYCGTFASDETHSFLSVMYAFSKKALYTKPPAHSNTEIYAATYQSPGAWYRSVPPGGQALVEDNFKPFNNYIQPARPQTAEDVSKPPLFVMKVSDTLLSIATLTGEPMADMHSVDTAPRLVATLVGKGADFSNTPGQPEGLPAMPQPGTWRTLDAGDVGTVNRTFELRAYSAVQHNGLLYLTTSEYWGSGAVRMPSIYYAVVQPDEGLCSVSRLEWAIVASQDGLATAYPVIAARKDGSATLAFAYSGAGTISDGQSRYPAYPGVAYTTVGQSRVYGGDSSNGVIQVVKRGTGVIDKGDLLDDPQYWGTYSASQVWGDKMWFAVVVPQAVKANGDSEPQQKHGSWVSAVDLS